MNFDESLVICSNGELVRDYLCWLRDTRGRAGSTIYNYGSVLMTYIEHVGDKPIGSVRLHEIEAYVQRPRGGRALGRTASAATQLKDVTIIRAFYGHLVARGVLRRNPAALLGAPKVHDQNPRPIPDTHWVALWDTASAPVERVFLGLWIDVLRGTTNPARRRDRVPRRSRLLGRNLAT